LNPRPSGYEPDELPDCSIPRSLNCQSTTYILPQVSYLSNRKVLKTAQSAFYRLLPRSDLIYSRAVHRQQPALFTGGETCNLDATNAFQCCRTYLLFYLPIRSQTLGCELRLLLTSLRRLERNHRRDCFLTTNILPQIFTLSNPAISWLISRTISIAKLKGE
jgi:hypothetical protein